MTTAAQTPGSSTPAGGVRPVLRAALVGTLLLGLAASLLALAVTGMPGLWGAVIGTLMVCLFFGGGALVLDLVAGIAPALSLLVALLTYTLKVVLVGLVFLGLQRSGALDSAVDPQWLAGALIAGTMVWLALQVRASMRQRIPVYDVSAAAATDPADRPGTGVDAAAQTPLQSADPGVSEGKEASAR